MDGLLGGLLGGLASRGGGRGATTALVLGLGAAGVGTLAYLALGSATASGAADTSTAGGDGAAAAEAAARRRRRSDSEDASGSDDGDASDDGDGAAAVSADARASAAADGGGLISAQLQLAASAYTAVAQAVTAPVVDTARLLSVDQVALLLALCVVLLLLTAAEGGLRAYGVGDALVADAGRPPSPALWTAVGFVLAAVASAFARGAVDPAALAGALVELAAAAAGATAAALRGPAAAVKATVTLGAVPAPAAGSAVTTTATAAAAAAPPARAASTSAAAAPDAIPASGIVYDDVTAPGHSLNHRRRPGAAAPAAAGGSSSSSEASGGGSVVFEDALAAVAVGPSGVVVTVPQRRASTGRGRDTAEGNPQVDARPTLLEPVRADADAVDDGGTAHTAASGPLPPSPPASSRASSRVSADWSDGSLDALLAGVLAASSSAGSTAATTVVSSGAASAASVETAAPPAAQAPAAAPVPPAEAAVHSTSLDASVPGDVPLLLAERACSHLASADAALAAADYPRCQASLDAVVAALDVDSVPVAPDAMDAVLPPLPTLSTALPPLSPPLPPLRTRLLAAALHRRGRLRSLLAPLPAHTPPASKAAAYRAGLADVLRSLSLWEPEPEAHKWAGILLARSAADTRERIANGYKIKEHALRAAELRPADPVLQHILGVWCFEVASLGWVQRKVATALFGAPPTSSFDEALAHFERADALAATTPGARPMMTTRLMAAKAAAALGRPDDAARWLARSAELAPGPGEDEDAAAQQAALAASLGVALPPPRAPGAS